MKKATYQVMIKTSLLLGADVSATSLADALEEREVRLAWCYGMLDSCALSEDKWFIQEKKLQAELAEEKRKREEAEHGKEFALRIAVKNKELAEIEHDKFNAAREGWIAYMAFHCREAGCTENNHTIGAIEEVDHLIAAALKEKGV